MKHDSKWIEEKQCWRLVHPDTGDFIAEYYPSTNKLVVTKHRKTASINLNDYQIVALSSVYTPPYTKVTGSITTGSTKIILNQ